MKHYSDFTVIEWLNYLENRHHQEIQLELARIKQVAESLDLLSAKAKIITIAGTNGKGSTVAALEAIYVAAGYQVASYISPHLLDFNERIRINQKNISDKALCAAFSAIEQGRGKTALTYFEMTTLAALWHFNQYKLDLIILEVGLGGRLDATNIIDSDLAIITTIDFDHQAYLGDTKEAIGYEKAGIIRPHKPFIFADKNPPATVVAQASALKASAYYCGLDYDYRLIDETIELSFQGRLIKLPKPKLHANSAIAAIMSSLLLKDDLPITQHHWEQALKTVFLPARLQVISAKVSTLFDVAHNPQAAMHLAQFIRNFQPKKAVHAVFSALKDKDIPGLIAPLQDCVDHWYPALLGSKRAASREQLILAFKLYNNETICYNEALVAYDSAWAKAKEGDLIVVYGSFVTVSEVMSAVYKKRSCVDKILV